MTGEPLPARQVDGDGSLQERLLTILTRRRLSPTQRRVARHILDHPREAPFLSSVALALRAGVSQPSVTRLAVALGYKGYPEFQKSLRSLVLSAPSESSVSERGDSNKFQSAVVEEIRRLEALVGFLADASAITDVGRHLAASDPCVVLGLRASAPLAAHFGYFAAKVHPDVRVIDSGGSVAADQLAQARHAGGKWVLCFLLPRYPRETLEAMFYAKDIGFHIATVTDRAPRSVAQVSDVVLPAEVGTQLVFDSHATAMVLSTVLLEALCDAASARTQARLEDFERRAAQLELFVTE